MYIELAFIKMVDHHRLKQIDYDAEIEKFKTRNSRIKNTSKRNTSCLQKL